MASEFSDNIGGWAQAMEKVGLMELATKLRQDNGEKVEILERIRLAGLPVQPSRLVSLRLFLDNPETTLADFHFPLYWALLMPKDPNTRKFTEVGIDRQSLIDFAQRNSALVDDFDLLINQFEENIFGGQIISNDSLVFAEMGRAKQTDVVHGLVEPGNTYSATKRAGELAFSVLHQRDRDKKGFLEGLTLHCLRARGTRRRNSAPVFTRLF